ncbi:MAG: PD-(D/E)XK nuclease family protein [Dehalococcoidia bacterium]|nr:PD-(D/E)XK nuclease family protein [Dehalococcoidia bacterium]
MSGQLFRLTFTKLRSFERCRKQYWFRYLSGREWPPDVPTPALIVGKGVHRAMKTLCETGRPEDGASELDTYLRMPIHECAGPGTDGHRDAFALFERGCEAHASIESEASWPELDTWVPWESRGLSIRARMDRADRLGPGQWQIVDWKTGRYELDEHIDTQLDISHLALRVSKRLAAQDNVTAIGWNLRTGERRERRLTRADARATMFRMHGLAERMQKTVEFEATPGPGCAFCEWRPQCAAAAAVPLAIDALEWDEFVEPASEVEDQPAEFDDGSAMS